MRVIAATGHRPETLPAGTDVVRLKKAIADFIKEVDTTQIVEWRTGGQRGVDLWVAQAALAAGHKVDVYLPFPKEIFTSKWTDAQDHEDLEEVMSKAKEVQTYSQVYSSAAYKVRDRAMVDDAEELFGVWDGRSKGGTSMTIKYADKKRKPRMVMHPISLSVSFTSY